MYNMKIKGATTVLNKERIFLGLTMKELLIFIERNPYAFPNKTILASFLSEDISFQFPRTTISSTLAKINLLFKRQREKYIKNETLFRLIM